MNDYLDHLDAACEQLGVRFDENDIKGSALRVLEHFGHRADEPCNSNGGVTFGAQSDVYLAMRAAYAAGTVGDVTAPRTDSAERPVRVHRTDSAGRSTRREVQHVDADRNDGRSGRTDAELRADGARIRQDAEDRLRFGGCTTEQERRDAADRQRLDREVMEDGFARQRAARREGKL